MGVRGESTSTHVYFNEIFDFDIYNQHIHKTHPQYHIFQFSTPRTWFKPNHSSKKICMLPDRQTQICHNFPFSSTFLDKNQHRPKHTRLCSGKPHTLPDHLTFSNIDLSTAAKENLQPTGNVCRQKSLSHFPLLTRVPLFLLPQLLEGWMKKKKN